jgi:WD40 repeat protein
VAERRSQPGKYGDVRDTFGLGVPKQSAQSSMTHGNVAVTCVAWSPIQSPSGGNDGGDPISTQHQSESEKTNTMVAAAGSNGVVVVWSSETFFPEGRRGSSTLGNQQPQGYLSQHTRAVNSLAWHPRRPGLLLTASQVCLGVFQSTSACIT